MQKITGVEFEVKDNLIKKLRKVNKQLTFELGTMKKVVQVPRLRE